MTWKDNVIIFSLILSVISFILTIISIMEGKKHFQLTQEIHENTFK